MYQLPEHGILCSYRLELSCSVFQCTVEDHQTSTQDTKDSTSNSGINDDIVVFNPDAEPNTPDEYEYHLKNPILQALDDAQKLNYTKRLNDLGNSNNRLPLWPMLI